MDYKYIAYADDLLFNTDTQPQSKPLNLKAILLVIFTAIAGLSWIGMHILHRSAPTLAPTLADQAAAQASAIPTSITPQTPVMTQVMIKPIVPPHWEIMNVKAGNTLSSIFKQAGIEEQEVQNILAVEEAAKFLTKLRPSAELRLLIDPQHKLQQLNYLLNDTDILQVLRRDNTFQTQIIHQKLQTQLVYAGTNISQTISRTLQKAGLPNKLRAQLASIFKDQIDINRLHNGDRFNVLFEETHVGEKKLGTGNIVAAELVNNGKAYRAVRYATNGHVTYYTPDGQSLSRGFLRSPVNYSHVSSGYSMRRYDPVMHKVHAHPAVDLAAPMGTPIKATGDGKVAFAGRKGGYGNTVMINHAGKYATLYAHMQHFASGIHSGSSVSAGQTIGYVGRTGMTTGPHVHYEIRVNGVTHNPMTIALPSAQPLDKAARAHFIPQARQLMAQLETDRSVRLASNASISSHGG